MLRVIFSCRLHQSKLCGAHLAESTSQPHCNLSKSISSALKAVKLFLRIRAVLDRTLLLMSILDILVKGGGLINDGLAYGILVPYVVLMVPLRAAYHLGRIFLLSYGTKQAQITLSSSGLPQTTSESPIQMYEDLEPYNYTPLPSNRHIRLLRLHPPRGRRKHDIECELLPLSLDHSLASFAYQAISYTWDGQTPDREIICEGKKLRVTKNCAAILCDLRSFGGTVLWIDAICIDQSNVEEKNSQVSLMCEIYKSAWRVVVWFGEPALGNGLIFNYLWVVWCTIHLPRTVRHWIQSRLFLYMMDHGHIESLRDIMQRKWWQRVWTIQETALSPPSKSFALKTTVLRCGKDEIPFDLLSGNVLQLSSFDALTDKFPMNHIVWVTYLLSHHMPRLAQTSRQMQITAPHHMMLHRNRACGVFEPKDRVYGVYGLLMASGLKLPPPNYLKTVDEIYWEFTATLCQQTQSIKFLVLVSGRGAHPNAPSWVPDFNETWRVGDLMGIKKATGDSQAEFYFSDDNKMLIAHGRMIDMVSMKSHLTTWQPKDAGATVQDGPLVNLHEGFEQTIRAFKDWARVLFEHGSLDRYEDSANFLGAFGEALVQGMEIGLTSPHYKDQNDALFTWVGWISNLLSEENRAMDRAAAQDDPLIKKTFYQNPELRHLTESEEWQTLCTLKTHPRTAQMHHAIWMLTRDKAFFVTVRGYVGTGPPSIGEDDVVVLLAGVERPMVLRPVDEEWSTWKVVGPAYISGMMNGELWEEGEMQEFRLI